MDYFNVPIPVAPPPPGVTPDFIHPASRTNVAVAVCTTVLVVTFIFFGVRVYTRLKITPPLGHDDCKLPSLCMKLKLSLLDTCFFAMVNQKRMPMITSPTYGLTDWVHRLHHCCPSL